MLSILYRIPLAQQSDAAALPRLGSLPDAPVAGVIRNDEGFPRRNYTAPTLGYCLLDNALIIRTGVADDFRYRITTLFFVAHFLSFSAKFHLRPDSIEVWLDLIAAW